MIFHPDEVISECEFDVGGTGLRVGVWRKEFHWNCGKLIWREQEIESW
jgi:hypothetical protein